MIEPGPGLVVMKLGVLRTFFVACEVLKPLVNIVILTIPYTFTSTFPKILFLCQLAVKKNQIKYQIFLNPAGRGNQWAR